MVREPYYLPRIGETMKQLEGFYRKKSLYINMGYCTIRIYLASQDMTTIVTEYGKFRYNRLPMGMCWLVG